MLVALTAIETSDPSDLLPATVEPRKAEAADQPWLTPQERNHAGFANTRPFGLAKPPAVATRSLADSEAPATVEETGDGAGAVVSDGIEEHLSV